ncbi:MAG TPA: D-alanyl-D-alanine carboxypeptidase/D-alanyl-D-alanine-endopeptidase [Gemmatimonadaceae bacterium]|nr:D-alanyl-D-alanine carboxypeptidase/D-alanyl-D-alanine-endopeptidase [Gemmatimonadaceae bacterium]
MILSILLAASLPFHAPMIARPTLAWDRASVEAERPAKKTGPKKKVIAQQSRAKSVKLAAPKSPSVASTNAAAGAIHWTAPTARIELADDLSSMIGRAKTGKWGVLVVSLSNGDTLFGRNPDEQLLPASTMKLFTSSLALDRFGADGKFSTTVLRTGQLAADGTLHGDLMLRGAGDPTLAGKAAELGAEPPMEALARQIAATGIRRVTGSVVGDASAFLDGHVPEGWRTRYLQASYAARVSALSFNENKITIVVRPNGGHAELSFLPAVSGVPVENAVKITPSSTGGRIGVRQDSAGRLVVSGWIGSQSGQRDYQVMVEGPELFAAGALRAALIAQGVTVDGQVRIGRTPLDAVSVATFDSPPLQKIVTQMNGESNNHFAELLFRDAAQSVGTPGSAENGNILLRRFLYEKADVAPTAVFAADGSGLSTLDRVTPRAMVQLLGYVRKAPWGSVLEQSLPVAGQTETLKHRMRHTPAMGNLHAKTGTTNDVNSLGGYVTAKNGEQLVFAFIYNGKDHWRAKEAMDAMGATLASFSR